MRKVIEWFYGKSERPPEGWLRYLLYKCWFTVRFFSWAMVRSKLDRRRVLREAERVRGWLPLVKLDLGHPVNFHWTDKKLAQRVTDVAVWAARPYDGTARLMPLEEQQRLMGSATPIRVVRDGGRYVVYDGNGRVAALRAVLGDKPLLVEVELLR